MKPFLDCNIWSINIHSHNGFYTIERVYSHNSSTTNINRTHNPECYQIPEFEISKLDLLTNVNLQLVNDNCIPIIVKTDDIWEINLFHYNDYIKNNNM